MEIAVGSIGKYFNYEFIKQVTTASVDIVAVLVQNQKDSSIVYFKIIEDIMLNEFQARMGL